MTRALTDALTHDVRRLADARHGLTPEQIASRLSLDPADVRRVLAPRKTAVTLFSGIGSSSRAAQNTGHRLLACVESWQPAADTLRAHGFPVVQRDVKTIDFANLRAKVDLVAGGAPCQPFSQSADNAGEYDERDCIPDFIRAVRDLQPELFILEEVPTLTWKRHADYLARVLADLRALGYTVDYRVLDLSKQGVAQKRRRLFVIGRRGDRPVRWPDELEVRTMADALGWNTLTCRERNLLAPPLAHDAERCLWPMTRPSTTVVGSFRPDVQAAPGYRVAGDGPRQNAPGSVVITEAEAKILQGLPPWWQVCGNEAQRRLQIGNTCPSIALERLITTNQEV